MAHNFPLRALNVLISSVTLHLVLSVTENNDTLVLGRNLWIEHYKQRKWRRTLMFVHVCVCVCVCRHGGGFVLASPEEKASCKSLSWATGHKGDEQNTVNANLHTHTNTP